MDNDFEISIKGSLKLEEFFDFKYHDDSFKKLFEKFNKIQFSKEEMLDIENLYSKTILPKLQKPNYKKNKFLKYHLKKDLLQNIESETKRNYMLLYILNKYKEIFSHCENFFSHKIKESKYGIADVIKSIFTKDVMKTKDYEIFLENLSKWNGHIEFILLFIDISLIFYRKYFDYEKKGNIQNYLHSAKDVAFKSKIYELLSIIAEEMKTESDYSNIPLFVVLGLYFSGFDCSKLFNFIPKKNLLDVAKVIGLNMVYQKIADTLKFRGNLIVLQEINNQIKKLNQELFDIEKKLFNYLKLQIEQFLDQKLGIEDEKKKNEIEQLHHDIEKCLYIVNLENSQKNIIKIEEEYKKLESNITQEEIAKSFVLVNFKKDN